MKVEDIRFNVHKDNYGKPYLVAETPGIIFKLKIKLSKEVTMEEAKELAEYLEENITEMSRAFF